MRAQEGRSGKEGGRGSRGGSWSTYLAVSDNTDKKVGMLSKAHLEILPDGQGG